MATTPIFTAGGLASGLDTNSIVERPRSVHGHPGDLLEPRKELPDEEELVLVDALQADGAEVVDARSSPPLPA